MGACQGQHGPEPEPEPEQEQQGGDHGHGGHGGGPQLNSAGKPCNPSATNDYCHACLEDDCWAYLGAIRPATIFHQQGVANLVNGESSNYECNAGHTLTG